MSFQKSLTLTSESEIQEKVEEIRIVLEKMLRLMVAEPTHLILKCEINKNQIRYSSTQERVDVRRILGKGGKNANAIRRWLSSSGALYGLKCTYEIVED